MITMNELVDLRMQQHIAHEIYRQQIMQRIPDPFPSLLPMSMPRHVIMPPRVTLPGVDVTLQNDDLWKQFHQIGTEMIITKSGRRMFPSMRLSLSGLEDETNYCILLEMVPIGDCRYKFSGSQWVPAGGAEPQSPQRMCLHPDSPATGAHWQAQPILFNKVKLTNNTLDNNGHIVLASMHKYQPRIHVIRTSDLAQIPWAPQQAFVFPETEFVAVTAYQNDRITKLKIDNNPFAKGFRETGQSRCKRKMSSSPTAEDQQQTAQLQQQHHQLNNYRQQQQQQQSPTKSLTTTAAGLISESASSSSSSICMDKPATLGFPPEHHLAHQQQHYQHLLNADAAAAHLKRLRANTSACSLDGSGGTSALGGGISVITNETSPAVAITPMDYINNAAGNIFPSPTNAALVGTVNNNNSNNNSNSFASNSDVSGSCNATSVAFMHHFQQNMQTLLRPSLVDLACTYFARPQPLYPPHVYAVAAQHEALVAATQQQQQPSLPTLTQATPSLLLPTHPSLVHNAATNLSADDVNTGGGGGSGDGDGELPNRVMAINSNTTLEYLTNDADFSSSDSSLIQDESNTTATATPTPTPLTTPSVMSSSSATCNTNDDTLLPSPSASNNSSIICKNHNNNNTSNNGHKAKRKGFSISAILGGGS